MRLAERNRLDALSKESQTARKAADKAEDVLASRREELSSAETSWMKHERRCAYSR